MPADNTNAIRRQISLSETSTGTGTKSKDGEKSVIDSVQSPLQLEREEELRRVKLGRLNPLNTSELSDSSLGFFSEPSCPDESDHGGSSKFDFQRKMMYRQRLREFDHDGDTSLSSSNISPTPQRFRIQFNNSFASDGTSVKSGGRVRNKIAASMASTRNSNEQIPPTMPDLSRNRESSADEENNSTSADSNSSIQGTRITEQSGGEPSSSAIQSDLPSHQFHIGSTEGTGAGFARRNPRRNSAGHRRVRSGDGRAADIMNSSIGRPDWMGQLIDNIPIPEDVDDDDASSGAMLFNSMRGNLPWVNDRQAPSPGQQPLAFGVHRRQGSASASSPTMHVPGQFEQLQHLFMTRSNSTSGDTFDLSDASGSHSAQIASHERRPSRHVRFLSRSSSIQNSPGQNHDGWLAAYQDANGITRQRRMRDDDDESSFGSYSSNTSSSYTDNSDQRPRTIRIGSKPIAKASNFDKIMKRVNSVLNVDLYRQDETVGEDGKKACPTFYCPNCKTYQRDFINFATATGQYDTPLGYLALYFAMYLVASLTVFGFEEGWSAVDCIYFSVITLTTAGLGDLVPTTDEAKIVCSCFIFIGVATIGLLLGTLIADSLDKAKRKEANEAQIHDCPHCAKLANKTAFPAPNRSTSTRMQGGGSLDGCVPASPMDGSIGLDLFAPQTNKGKTPQPSNVHTRHMSIEVGSRMAAQLFGYSAQSDSDPMVAIDESTPFFCDKEKAYHSSIRPEGGQRAVEMKYMDPGSFYSSSSTEEADARDITKPMTRLKAMKYVFVTLNQALMNAGFILAIGTVGFHMIENVGFVDSFYFTTCLLTSVGYGDVVPKTDVGKVFTTVFVIIAGTVLLHNMTLISMIPLELRKRRVEHAVLGQFGGQLTDDELRELSTGRLINRLKLATNRPAGLEECTREMFSLAMLVRLGRITEDDVKATFSAFRRLDIGNHGKLNSRTIIEGEVMRVRSQMNIAAMTQAGESSELEDGSQLSSAPQQYAFQHPPEQMHHTSANRPPAPSRQISDVSFGSPTRGSPYAFGPVYDSMDSFVRHHRHRSDVVIDAGVYRNRGGNASFTYGPSSSLPSR